jgi:Ca2+-binding RTX toxin-like protein
MATVVLNQPTDMASLSTDLAILTTVSGADEYDGYSNFSSTRAFFSFLGQNITVDANSDLTGGLITTAVFDGPDSDLVPDLVISDLSFSATYTNLGVLLLSGHANFAGAIAALMSKGDHVIGSSGDDTLMGFGGNDVLEGGTGFNRFEGGPGADKLKGGPDGDQAQYSFASSGVVADLLHPGKNKGEAKGDTYHSIEDLRGSDFSDTLKGDNGPNVIGGYFGGNDKLFGRGGNDILATAGGHDLLDGGTGFDQMTGGGGPDRFDFNSMKDSVKGGHRDVIEDFSHIDGDLIDLSTIDANAGKSGNQKFVFIGTDTFKHYHSVHHNVIGMIRLDGDIVQGNVNANLGTDFEIKVVGGSGLVAGDFIL